MGTNMVWRVSTAAMRGRSPPLNAPEVADPQPRPFPVRGEREFFVGGQQEAYEVGKVRLFVCNYSGVSFLAVLLHV